MHPQRTHVKSHLEEVRRRVETKTRSFGFVCVTYLLVYLRGPESILRWKNLFKRVRGTLFRSGDNLPKHRGT